MPGYEYKVIPAPHRAARVKGARTGADCFAQTLAGLMNTEAVEGWEYYGKEVFSFEAKPGMFRRSKSGEETFLIFRRDNGVAAGADGAPRQPLDARLEKIRARKQRIEPTTGPAPSAEPAFAPAPSIAPNMSHGALSPTISPVIAPVAPPPIQAAQPDAQQSQWREQPEAGPDSQAQADRADDIQPAAKPALPQDTANEPSIFSPLHAARDADHDGVPALGPADRRK